MGSVGNPNPWSPYDNFKDCSLQICSIYCPQFCYFIFPPPPPDDDDDSSAPFSPLIIAIIAVLSSAFLLVSYYTIVTRFCRRRRQSETTHNPEDEEIINNHENAAAANHDQWQVGASAGLDESVIKTIPFCKYVKGGALIDGTECAVCLSEFREGECLRLLPKCSHAFHLPCVDTWLKSHSNCPLCRAGVSPAHDTVDLDDRSDDLVLTVVDDGGDGGEDGGVSDHDEESNVKRGLGRSVSLGDFTVGPRLLILKIDGDEGSWRGIMGNSSKGSEMRRSVSTGRIP